MITIDNILNRLTTDHASLSRTESARERDEGGGDGSVFVWSFSGRIFLYRTDAGLSRSEFSNGACDSVGYSKYFPGYFQYSLLTTLTTYEYLDYRPSQKNTMGIPACWHGGATLKVV